MSNRPALDQLVGGRYRLSSELGQGAVGTVWRAFDEKERRDVALKLLLHQNAEAEGRFRREARALLALRHPNIVGVSDVVEEGDAVTAIVMELLGGETLRSRIAREAPLPPSTAARILHQVSEGVRFAHGQGVLHRDLKPENVLITPEGRVVVLDFGLAKWSRKGPARAGSVVTEHGAVLGTLPYMAPEQLIDVTSAGAAADLWAIGVMLYECIAGFRPIEGETDPLLVRNILTGAIAPLSFVAVGVPAELAEAAASLLARDPGEREAGSEAAFGQLSRHAGGAE